MSSTLCMATAGSPAGTKTWAECLVDAPELLRLPPKGIDICADEPAASAAIASATVHALGLLRERHGTSSDVILLSAWAALLYRMTEQNDLLLQYALHSAENGMAAVLPLRLSIEQHTTFEELLLLVAQWTRHAAATTEELRTAFAAISASRQQSVHGISLVFLGKGVPAELAGRFQLALQVHSSAELVLTPNAAPGFAVASMLEWLQHLLSAAAREPATRVGELPLLSASQRQTLLELHAGPRLQTGRFEPVHAVVLRNAASHPERIAVVCDGASLTYGQLADRATAIAHGMLGMGIAPYQRVALCVRRSLDMPASLLAILMCGCTYVPLDPLFPPERMQAAIDDAEVALLLTDGFCEALPPQVTLLRLQTIGCETHEPQPAVEICQSDLAYIMYTSGSTGKPKGVMIHHAALRNLLCAAQQSPGFSADDVLVAITTLTFDISVMDIWLPLFSGARLVLATYEESRSPALLEVLLRQSGATLMEATPGLWRAMVEHGWTTRAPGAPPVRALCGGEALSRELADLLLQRAVEVWNMYGPTECTVWVSATRVLPGEGAPGIDDALSNCQMYVLDPALQPVPAGIAGELVIGGGNVGAGYWNRPELSADRFVPNPFGEGMLYRTGDLAQLRPQGGLRLLGRADFQVKLRGFRIELGEIEHVLSRHPAVRSAIVVQQEMPGEDASKPLVAYVEVGDTLPRSDYVALTAALSTLR